MSSRCVTKIRQLFRAKNAPMTMREIRDAHPELPWQSISSTLCYLRKQRYVIRTLIPNELTGQRGEHKQVWQYMYSDIKWAEWN